MGQATSSEYSTNSFGLKLLKVLLKEQQPKENVFISPYSIASALGMVSLGATNAAHAELLQSLEVADEATLRRGWHALNRNLQTVSGVTLEVANSLWISKGGIKAEYTDAVVDTFQSEVLPLVSAEEVNDWCAKKTHNKIPRILDSVESDVVAILINAVYFKANWAVPFDPAKTEAAPFVGVDWKVNMMSLHRSDYHYVETPSYQAVALPYGPKKWVSESKYSAVVVLPKEGHAPASLEPLESAEKLRAVFAELQASKREGTLFLPAFQAAFELRLKDILSGPLGIPSVFQADTRPLDRIKDECLLSEVIHKAVIELDEKGTVAAAVTAAMAIEGCLPPEKPVVTFTMRCSRPFLFFLVNNSSHEVLFSGLITSPTPAPERSSA